MHDAKLFGVLAHIVGHADVDVSMTIYAHASLDDQRKAPDKLAVCWPGRDVAVLAGGSAVLRLRNRR
jgi:hypothetical protein